jgi:hypothetical protein
MRMRFLLPHRHDGWSDRVGGDVVVDECALGLVDCGALVGFGGAPSRAASTRPFEEREGGPRLGRTVPRGACSLRSSLCASIDSGTRASIGPPSHSSRLADPARDRPSRSALGASGGRDAIVNVVVVVIVNVNVDVIVTLSLWLSWAWAWA